MDWFVPTAELVEWRSTPDRLSVELLIEESERADQESPVVQLELVAPQAPLSLDKDMRVFAKEGVWAVGQEARDAGIEITFEGEGWSLCVPCKELHVQRLALQPRHYERIVERYRRQADWATAHSERLQARMRRLEVFLRQQAERSKRIVNEAGPQHEHRRLRAEGRLSLLSEIKHVVNEAEDGSETTG